MKLLSLEPDDDMRWIYDQTRPGYNDPRTRHLRDARDSAIRNAPEWMVSEAEMNDAAKKHKNG